MPSSVNFENSDLEDSIDGSSVDEEDIRQRSEIGEDDEEHSLDERATEQNRWMQKNLQEKLEDVLTELEQKHPYREDALASRTDVDLRVIDMYKLKGLLEPTRHEHFIDTPTALHIMAKCYSRKFNHFSKRVLKGVIRFLLEEAPSKPAITEGPGPADKGHSAAATVLMTAMRYNKGDDEFLEHVRDYSTEKLAELLDEKDGGGRNSLHAVFASYSREFDDERALTLRRAKLLVPLAKPTTITAKSAAEDGNTPLHLALHYEQVKKRTSEYHDVVRLMITRGDERGMADAFNTTKDRESPILFHKRTKRIYNKNIKLARENLNANKPESSSNKTQAGISSKLLGPKTTSSTAPQSPVTTAKPSWPEKDQKDKKTKSQKNQRPEIPDDVPQRGITKTLTGEPVKQQVQQTMDRSRGTSARGSSSRSTTSAAHEAPNVTAPAILPTVPETQSEAGSVDPRSKPGPSSAVPSATSKKKSTSASKTKTKSKDDSPNSIDLIEFLKHHYIRTLSELEARDLIYGKIKASDINLSFDGTGLADAKAIRKLIRFMKAGGGFSPTLASVRLPTVARIKHEDISDSPAPRKTYGANQKLSRSKGEPKEENPHPGRDELVAVFEELAKAGVRTIMRLEVDDLEPQSHSDVSIETALRPVFNGNEDKGDSKAASGPGYFSIEEWNWKKPDICIDVIEHVAPEVREVNLYWSGNRSTLRAWSCEAGLPRLYSGKMKLKRVVIHAAPGVEKLERMDRDLKLFEYDVKRYTKKDVKIKIEHRMHGLQRIWGVNHDTREGGTPHLQADRQHAWIEHIENFRKELVYIHDLLAQMGSPSPPRVKVALIDDGMDLGSFQVRDGVDLTVQGLSCTSSSKKTSNPWYRSSQGHGTTMANMMLRVNPWISLYVMKLSDDVSSEGGGTTISADSAAQAIQAAIARNVDIISMSWTVQQKLPQTGGEGDAPVHNDGISKLREAIKAAEDQGILMFCSASDKIDANARDSLPYGAAPTHIFRIGAADSLGQFDPLVESKQEINYFFPGKKVQLAYDPRAQNSFVSIDDASVDGSSVATALAAGLASLIKYSAVLVGEFYESRPAADAASQQDTGSKKSLPLSSIELNTLERAKLKAQNGRPDKFKFYAESLSNRVYLESAFNNIDADGWLPESKKFLPVWGTFATYTKKMKDADNVVKMENLEELVTHLCTKFALISSHSHGLSHRTR